MPFETKTKYGTQRDNTEFILRTLESIKRAILAGNITTDLTTVESLLTSIDTELNSQATLIEQQSQTTLLTSIDGLINSIDTATTNLLAESQSQSLTLTEIDNNTDNLETLLTLDKDTGASTANTLRVVLEQSNSADISDILTSNQSTNTILQYENWDKIPGNSKVFTWVAGAVAPFVIDTIEYYTGITLQITQTFTYDANDNVLTITAT